MSAVIATAFHVAVYAGDEAERTLARQYLTGVVEHESMFEGMATEEAIRTLARHEIVVTLLEPEAPPETVVMRSKRSDPGLQTMADDLVAMASAGTRPASRFFDRMFTPRDILATLRESVRRRSLVPVAVDLVVRAFLGSSDENAYRVRFRGPIRPEWARQLAERKIDLLSYRRGTYQAFLTREQFEWLSGSELTAEVKPYDLLDSVSTALLTALERREANDYRLFDLVLHRATDRRRVEAVIRTLAGKDAVHESRGHFIRFEARLEQEMVATLANLPWVRSFLPCKPARLFVDRARVLAGLPEPALAAAFPWTGSGELVAVIDSGIDLTHPDFARVLHGDPVSYRNAPVNDVVGHGTHIAGIIAGSGEASKDAAGTVTLCGVAPGAKLVVVANIEIRNQRPVPIIPADIEELFDLAVGREATILNVSWGRDDDELPATYDPTAETVDRYVWNHPEILVVVAAGNSGRAPEGFCAFQTLATPATAKNVLTVGACASDRAGIAETWGQAVPTRFPRKVASDEPVAGDPELVAGISARGPTDYRSVKPDLVAPGTYVLAPLSATFHPDLKPVPDPARPRYAHMTGTSMATPVAAACAAIVRQYLRVERATPKPSAALLKAILIGSARRIRGSRDPQSAASIGFPDFDQGFGRIELEGLLPPAPGAPPARLLAFADVRTDAPDALTSGAAHGYSVFVREKGSPLVITLVWTDWPGNDVQDRLTLDVRGPGGRFFGNASHVFGKNLLPGMSINNDPNNTVQQVRIDDARAGEYVIRIVGARVLRPAQGYAVTAIGDLKTADLRRLKNV